MAAKYAFPCPKCAHVFDLVTTQAGQELTCPQCSAVATAPRLGQLKQLERMDQEPTAKGKTRRIHNGLFVAGILLAIIGLGGGAGLLYRGQSLIVDYNVEAGMDRIEKEFADDMPPEEVVNMFLRMNVDAGLPEWKEQDYVGSSKQGNILIGISYGFFGLGVLGLGMLASSFVVSGK